MMKREELSCAYASERERISGLLKEEAVLPYAGDFANPVFGEGPEEALLMLIGEAPGREEAEAGRPFVGKAGRELDALLTMAGIDRACVFVTNAVKYRPIKVKARSVANRTPSKLEIRAGSVCLAREIELVRPKLIATLGNTPLGAVLLLAKERAECVGGVHGKTRLVALNTGAFELFPLYHPASVIYNRELRHTLDSDIIKLASELFAKGGSK